MTSDERLRQLAKQQKALTRSLKLLASDLRKLKKRVQSLSKGTARLLRIAQMREQRIKAFDNKGQ